MKRFLIISTSADLVRIAPERIVYISSDSNYSTLVQTDGKMRMLSYQLGQIEKMISSQLGTDGNIFIRIGKSLIINRSYIYYINVAKQKLTLSDVASFSHTVSATRATTQGSNHSLQIPAILFGEEKVSDDNDFRISR